MLKTRYSYVVLQNILFSKGYTLTIRLNYSVKIKRCLIQSMKFQLCKNSVIKSVLDKYVGRALLEKKNMAKQWIEQI